MSRIAIDAGHGLYTAGKRCMKKLDSKETREWTLNDRIADKLVNLLSSYKCEILRVDDTTGKKDISLADRVKKANNWKADIYISIHHNAGVNGGSGGGTVVFFSSNKIERSNQALALYNAIIDKTGLKGNRSQKVINKGFYVIKNTKAPAFLIENGFMDSKTDVPIILTDSHATKTANGILNFLVKELKLVKKAEPVKVKEETKSFKVKIKAHSLNYRAGAGTTYKAKGVVHQGEVYTIVAVSGSWGKLKSGEGWINISDKYVTRL